LLKMPIEAKCFGNIKSQMDKCSEHPSKPEGLL
jgi:hypothetical protein